MKAFTFRVEVVVEAKFSYEYMVEFIFNIKLYKTLKN